MPEQFSFGRADASYTAVKMTTLEFAHEAPALGRFAEGTASVELVQRDAARWAYRFRLGVLAEELPPERVTRFADPWLDFPASPWQHFKSLHTHRWWLRWLVARRPVRYVRHHRRVEMEVFLQRWRTYPMADVPLPEDPFGQAVYKHAVEARAWTGADWTGDPR